MKSIKRIKIKKQAFESMLIEKHGFKNLEACTTQEQTAEQGIYTRLTCYYNKSWPHGFQHCATWCNGEGWKFKKEKVIS